MSLDTPTHTNTMPRWPGFSARSYPIADPLGRHASPVLAEPLRHLKPGESELAALVHVHASVAGCDDPFAAVRAALAAAIQATNAEIGSLWLYQADGTLMRACHSGLSPEYLDEFAQRPAWLEHQIALLAQGSVLVQVHGQPDAEGVRGLVAPPGIHSTLVVPMQTRGLRVGGLLIGHPDAAWAEKHSHDFLQALGDILASALDTSRMVADLRAGHELHAGLLQAAHDAIVMTNPRGVVTEINPAFERLVGRSREAIIGEPLLPLLDPQSQSAMRERFYELIEKGDPMIGESPAFRHADGSWIPVVINATRYTDSAGVVIGAVGVVHDDRARRRSEVLVREAHDRLSRVLGHLDVGVALLGLPELEIVEHNPAFERQFEGRQPIGARLRSLLPESAWREFESLVQRALIAPESHALADVEVRFTDKSPRWWGVTLAALPSPGRDRPSLAVLTISDITSRRDLEERYRHAQKMEAVGTLAGGIAHEFNNLLTAIIGNVTLSLLDLPEDHPLTPGLRDCEAAAQRAADLTRQMLGFGRRTALRQRGTDLRDTLSDSLPLVSRVLDPRITIERGDAPDLWPVFVDPAHIGQALMNLCMNARDAMPDGGRLRVRTYNAPAGTAPGCEGDHVVLEVADNGQGIAPDVLERIWEPFFTTRGPSHGPGLGLSVVHGIVEQHGGRIDCESAPGQGTTFRIYLPRHVEPSRRASAAPGQGEVVLIVDDEESVRALARSVLERLGYRVLQAADGVQALDLVREMGAAIQLVILDQTMPRLSGGETLRQMRTLAPGLPVIMTSGYEPGGGPQGGTDPQADGFLPKPYAPELMSRVVRNLLDSHARGTDTGAVGRSRRRPSA
ncbi:MAG: PAS domain-containing protein [Candidatus Eisenbacteria bacterium]